MWDILGIIESMRVQLSGISDSENALARALEEALRNGDESLLQDVRNVTRGHEARRGTILIELEGLASRLGKFPAAQQESVAGVEYVEKSVEPLNRTHQSIGRADWRIAVSNIEAE